MHAGFAENGAEQVGCAVKYRRLLGESRRAVDVAGHAQHTPDAVKTAQRRSNCRQAVQRGKAGSFLALFDFNNDGRIDAPDLGQFAQRYLTTLP